MILARERTDAVPWRSATWLAPLAFGSIALVVGELLVLAHYRSGVGEIYGYWLEPLVSEFIMLALGVVLAIRRPDHPVTPIVVAAQLIGGLQTLFGAYAHWASSGPAAPLPGAAWSGLFATWAQLLTVVSWFLIMYFVPSGRLPSVRWRLPVIALAIAVPFNLLLDGTQTTPLDIGGLHSPLAASGVQSIRGVLGPILALLVVVGLVGGVLAPFVRYRRATGIERAQLRMIAFGAAAGVGIVAAASVPEGVVGERIGSVAWGVGPLMLPVAAGLAIVRYRLFDIDRVISRTLAYAIVVALLGALYAGTVLGLGQLLPDSGGDLVVAGSTLAVAAVFRPLRDRVRARIDRRFNRAAFDTREALGRFAARARDEVQLDALLGAVVAAARTTLQPASVSVWLPGSLPGGRVEGAAPPGPSAVSTVGDRI